MGDESAREDTRYLPSHIPIIVIFNGYLNLSTFRLLFEPLDGDARNRRRCIDTREWCLVGVSGNLPSTDSDGCLGQLPR